MEATLDLSATDIETDNTELNNDLSKFFNIQRFLQPGYRASKDQTKTFEESKDSFLYSDEDISAPLADLFETDFENMQTTKIVKDRMELLIRSYSRSPSSEEVTRLRLLNEKLKNYLPVISTDTFKYVESVSYELDSISQKMKKRDKLINKIK